MSIEMVILKTVTLAYSRGNQEPQNDVQDERTARAPVDTWVFRCLLIRAICSSFRRFEPCPIPSCCAVDIWSTPSALVKSYLHIQTSASVCSPLVAGRTLKPSSLSSGSMVQEEFLVQRHARSIIRCYDYIFSVIGENVCSCC